MSVTITVHWRARPGMEAELERACLELREATLAEWGCELYEVTRLEDRPGRIQIFEKYRDEASVEAHRASSHFKRIVVDGDIGRLLAERSNVIGTSIS